MAFPSGAAIRARSGRSTSRCRADGGNDPGLERFGRNRPCMFVDDGTLPIDNESLGHGDDAPLDGVPAAAVHPHGGEGIAVAAEETARVWRLVLVVDAVELDPGLRL